MARSRLSMANDKVTIKDLARELGVSIATVSRAFSKEGKVNAQTRVRVLKTAEALGYRPNANARKLNRQKSDTYGFLYPDLVEGDPDFFVTEISLGITEACRDLNRRVFSFAFPTPEIPNISRLRDILLDRSLDGLILLGGTASACQIRDEAFAAGLPIIRIGDLPADSPNVVCFDTSQSMRLAGDYYRRRGMKTPAYVSGIQDARKLAGLRDGLGPKLQDRLTVVKGGCRFEDGGQAFHRTWSLEPRPDCVVCATDVLALGFMREALQFGVKIPEEIAVVGCDNIKFAQYYTPSLTTIHIPKYELGRKAAFKLSALIENPTEALEAASLTCHLVMRESSG